jgi:hypothetical protein
MANAIPLLEGTNASGGFLRPDVRPGRLPAWPGPPFGRRRCRASQIRRVTGKRVQYTEYVGRPTAAFVAEGADKAATGAEYAQVTLNVKKIASIVMYTEELLEDAQGDPTVLVNQDVRAAFADLIDSHALGRNVGRGTLTTQFDAERCEHHPDGGVRAGQPGRAGEGDLVGDHDRRAERLHAERDHPAERRGRRAARRA